MACQTIPRHRVSRCRGYDRDIRALLSPIRDLLGDSEFPGARLWALGSLVDATGTGLIKPLTVLFFTIHVGLSTGSVGLGLTIAGLVSLAFAPLGGAAIDRLGARRMLIGAMALEGVGIAGFTVVSTFAGLVLAVSVAEIAASVSRTARTSLLAEIASDDSRVRLLAAQRSLRNLGYGIGGLLASVALAVGGVAYPVVALVDAGSFAAAIWFVYRLPAAFHDPRPATDRPPRPAAGLRRVLTDRRYLTLTGLDFFATFHGSALEIAMPLWIVLHTHAPRAIAGILFTLNTVIVVLAQVRATAGVRTLADAPRAYRRGAASIVVCAAAYLAARYVGELAAIVLLAAGVTANTACEMFVSAGEWTASIDLADERHRGSYLSVFSLGNSLQDAVGPTVVAGLLALGTVYLWPAMGAIVVAGALASAALTRRAAAVRRREPQPA